PAAVLPRANVDTDQIIPARFMSRSRSEGYGDQCFHDLRFSDNGTPRMEWPLGDSPHGPTVLIADENFGCGSSREAAVYALIDYGVEVVIAPSFADIFRSNAGKNGLLTISLPRDCVREIMDLLRRTPETTITIDLPRQRVQAGAMEIGFDVDGRLKYRLERGLDELSATLEFESAIADFETGHFGSYSWTKPSGAAPGQHET
ncbi:MAG TPA: 3-isopropylmalate dehydratase small subunit, partial [Sulfitobacter sp.]|nr:3-isopropylmalate dehydratase small subunit [Sulfitobacter sp.]